MTSTYKPSRRTQDVQRGTNAKLKPCFNVLTSLHRALEIRFYVSSRLLGLLPSSPSWMDSQVSFDLLSNHFSAFEAMPKLRNDLKSGDHVEEVVDNYEESVLVDDIQKLSPLSLINEDPDPLRCR